MVREERDVVTAHLGVTLIPDPEVLGPLENLSRHFGLAAVSSSAALRLDACFRATGLASLISPTARFSAEASLPVPAVSPTRLSTCSPQRRSDLGRLTGWLSRTLSQECSLPLRRASSLSATSCSFLRGSEVTDLSSCVRRERRLSSAPGVSCATCSFLPRPRDVRSTAVTATPVRMPQLRPMNRSVRISPVRRSFRRPPEEPGSRYRKGA
jgi:hypothetical protein